MKKTWKRLCTGFLAFATVVTALPSTPVHAENKQYWTESAERVGIIEKVMNDGSIGSTFNEGMMKVEGETAYCIDINEYMAENPEIKCELNEYGNVEIYDLSIEQVNELIRKYDLKELYGVEYQIDDDVMLKSCDEH